MRTNIYLPDKTINWLRLSAKEKGVTMSELIRRVLEEKIEKKSTEWGNSLLGLAKRATKSGIGDLAEKHDQYLLADK